MSEQHAEPGTARTVPFGTGGAAKRLSADEQLSDGCAIHFDNWNCNRANPRFGERKAWADCVEKYQLEYSDSGEYGCNGHKFILHR